MKAKLESENLYSLKVGDRKVEGLLQTGEWEGMRRLVKPDGDVVIVSLDDAGFSKFFREVFDGKRADEVVIVKASPAIWDALKPKVEDAVKAAEVKA